MKEYPIGTLLYIQNNDYFLGIILGYEHRWGSLHSKAYFFNSEKTQWLDLRMTSLYVDQYREIAGE